MKIRILLADDHQIMREGLKSLLEKQLDIEVIGQADNGRSAIRLATELCPDVVVMDVAMPDLNGIEATREILGRQPETKVLALSMHNERKFVARMLQAGASGYMLKDCAFKELVNAVRTVADDRKYLDPSIASIVIDEYVNISKSNEVQEGPKLSPRERETLQLIAEGKSSKEIANILHISIKTVQTHHQHIMRKLNVNNIADLIKYALREGITSP